MNKVRLYHLASNWEISSHQMMDTLSTLNSPYKSHMMEITPNEVPKIRTLLESAGLFGTPEPAPAPQIHMDAPAQESEVQVDAAPAQESVVDTQTAAVATDENLPIMLPLFENLAEVPVVLLIAVDLKKVASMDMELDRVGVVSGASIYPLAWSILMGARNEGFGGVMTTLIASAEPQVQALLGLEPHHAVAAMLPIGKPVKQLTKLKRVAVEEFTFRERADGDPFTV